MPQSPRPAAPVAPAGAAVAPPRGPWKADRTMGIIGLAMWAGTTVRVWNVLPAVQNAQCILGMVGMFVIAVAWPTVATRSYLYWRVPALAFLRVFCFALPFNFSTTVFDAIAPEPGTGRLAVLSNTFQMFLAVRVALLTFTSLGWRLPFRLHMVLQAVNVGLLMRFGLHAYCRSKLLSSPELEATTATLHGIMAFGAMVFVPSTAILMPQEPYAQRVALLLFAWMVLGWLLPTLLLLPEADAHRELGRDTGPVARLEAWLRLLLPPKRDEGQLQAGAGWLLHWWVVLLVSWGFACSMSSVLPNTATAAVAAA